MKISKRTLLQHIAATTLGARSSVWLSSIATGLPASVLANSLPSDESLELQQTMGLPRYLLMFMNANGDPINVNAPGSYTGVSDTVFHCPHPDMLPTTLTVGATTTRAAKPWAQMPQWILDRSAFVHHRTYQNVHSQMSKVLSLLGNTNGPNGETAMSDHLPSVIASGLAQKFDYVQAQPMRLGGSSYGYRGQPLPNLEPSILKSLLSVPNNSGAALADLRERELDAIYQLLKQTNASARQHDWLDQFAISHTQLQSIDQNLIQQFSALPNDSYLPVNAALLCFLMGLSPVISIDIPFGGDNHKETADYEQEASQLSSGLNTLTYLWEQAKTLNIADRLTVANLNVFGRTLHKQGRPGRQHNGNHHVMMITSANANASVNGGIDEGLPDKIGAGSFDSATGMLSRNGDITHQQSLESVAKTLGVVAGADAEYMDLRVQGGKLISHALKGR